MVGSARLPLSASGHTVPLVSELAAAVRRAALKAKGRTFSEIHERTVQFVSAELEHRGLAKVGDLSDSAFWARIVPSVEANVGRNADVLHEHFRRSPNTRFFVGAAEPRATARYLESADATHVARVIEAADRVRQGRFDLLGYTG